MAKDYVDRLESKEAGVVKDTGFILGTDYYPGADLSVKFAGEIGSTDIWTWIKQRIAAANNGGLADLHVADYIPFTCKNNVVVKSQIAGINIYRKYGDTEIGNHIDFVSKDLWPTKHVMNKVNWNNGLAGVSDHPWLASDLYFWLNSKAGTVANDTVKPPDTATVAVDYTSDGVLHYLPDNLVAAISEKRVLLPKRINASSIVSSDTSWGWADIGKLWILSEMEVYGTSVWGNTGYGTGGFIQYPLFKSKENQVKGLGNGGDRNYWWLLSPYAGSTTYWCRVNSGGYALNSYATGTNVGAPVCFRIK